MKLLKIALACSSLVLFWACSQSVSSPDKDSRGDDDLSDIPGFNQVGGNRSTKGSSANVGSESSSSTGGGTSSESFDFPDDGWGDDWFSDFGGGSANTSSGSTGMDVTKFVPNQKMDCSFLTCGLVLLLKVKPKAKKNVCKQLPYSPFLEPWRRLQTKRI